MVTFSLLLLENEVPNLSVLLIEPHRSHRGVWRIKFCYGDVELLSMGVQHASALATTFHQIGQAKLACEIDEAAGRAIHYELM